MADPKPNPTDAAEMAKEVERIIRQTPLDVIRDMDQRLQELRQTPEASTSDELMHKRAG